MPWATLASNQMVSYTDAQGGGFTLQPGQSAVTSNQCMTKTDATTKYVLDTSYLTAYASNQLIPKSVWFIGCCIPTLNSVVYSGANVNINWTLGCGTCSAVTVQSSTDNVNWGSGTGSCTSPRTYTAPTVVTYYRLITNCINSQNSGVSNVITFTPTTTTTTTLGSGTITVYNYEDEFGCAFTSATKNGSYYIGTGGNGASVSGTIATGDTFYGSAGADCYGSESLYVYSSTRGYLYSSSTGVGFPSISSDTYTRLTGENIIISGSFTASAPPPCFVAGTMITLSDGTKAPIETLSEGVELKSVLINSLADTNDFNLLHKWSSNDLIERRTTSTISKFYPEEVLITIKVNDGLLQATYNHIQLARVNNIWRMIRLEHLAVGDVLYDYDGNLIDVISIEVITEPITVYKLTLSDESHTYFANNILTHNIKPPPCFVKGTMISLSDGTQVPIETLAVGSNLESSLINTLEDTNNVHDLHMWSCDELVETRTGSSISVFYPEEVHHTIIVNDGLLETTPNHIQLARVNGVWRMINMEHLAIGDVLYDTDGNLIPVTSIETNREPRTVYKLTLSDKSHTYFANNILTHNIKEEFM